MLKRLFNRRGLLGTALTCTLILSSSLTMTWATPPEGKGPKNGDGSGSGEPGPAYSLTKIGTLGGAWSSSKGMNNLGDIVGTSENALGDIEPFLYTNADGMVPLNSLVDPVSGWIIWRAEDINDSGVIVGYGYVDTDGDGAPNVPSYAIRFLPDSDGDGYGTVESLDVPGGSPTAVAINADGDITGRHTIYDPELGYDVWHTFLWRPDALPEFQDLGRFAGLGTLPNDISGRDEQGDVQIVGRYNWRAFRYTTGIGYEDLGTLKDDGSGDAEAYAINSLGDVVGSADAEPKKGKEPSFAFLYVDVSGMTSLGTLSTARDWNFSRATSLNDSLEVVGMSATTFPDTRAFYYSPVTGMLDLENLIIDLPPELVGLIDVAKINNSGQVCGPISDNLGEAYIISPIPQ